MLAAKGAVAGPWFQRLGGMEFHRDRATMAASAIDLTVGHDRTPVQVSLHPLQPDVAIKSAVFLPVRLHLDVEEQMDLAAEQARKLLAGRGADRLDAGAAPAEDDGALRRASDEDLLVD